MVSIINLFIYVSVTDFLVFPSFFSLLTKAEEELDCEYVLIIFPKLSSSLETFGRIYRWFGFTLLSPTASLVPIHCSELYLFMAYKLND